MLPRKPERLEVQVIEADIKKCKDDKYEDGRFEVRCKKASDGFSGWVWCGMLVKDLYRDTEWHKILLKLKPLYLAWHGGGNNILVVEVWYKNNWHTIWSANNDFDSFAEERKSTDAYNNFAINEGKKVAKLIDQGKSFSQISKAMSKEHSGNTYGWAMGYGISKAKNRENAERVRIAHNKDCGVVDPKGKGVANPAVLTLEV